MNGKSDTPRPFSVSREQFEANWDRINWRRPEYRLVQGDGGKWYVIPTGDETVFVHWLAAERGERRHPQGFRPAPVGGPEGIVFKDWMKV